MPRKKSADAPDRAEDAEQRLERYRSMRDFSQTAEPAGEKQLPPAPEPRFVIQEHHASSLHWDLRLERDGVLVSFAVPKGIPPDPGTNHLAVHTEDHPLEYLTFEGEIAKGQYGAGQMFIWDRGTYETHKFRDSEVMVTLHGEKVQGKYVLFQTEGNNWMIHRMDPPQDPHREPMPERIKPMLAKLSGLPTDDAAYAFEIKWDGERAIAYSQGGRIRLESRNLLDITKQYPELAKLGETLGAHEAVLDGEIIAFNEEGVPSFERLQRRMHLTRTADIRRRAAGTPVVYMLFDLLYLDGRSTMHLPYKERRQLLESLELAGPNWQTPAYHTGDGATLLAASKEQQLEGIMAKRLDSPYEPGRRSSAWLKVKNNLRQEFVVAGWTPGAGVRDDSFGALLLGYYDRTPDQAEAAGEPQRLIFAGKVGTGFSDRLLRDLVGKLQRSRIERNPFDLGEPEPGSCFVEPELVCEVDFTEWTEAGTLRHPSFKGFRDDKPAREVVREDQAEAADKPPVVVGRPGPRARTARTARPARSNSGSRIEVEVEGRKLSLSNLEKEMYEGTGFAKAQVIDYYTRIAPVLLPHLRDRPMTLKRYPDGAQGPHFYEKQCPSHAPDWVQKARVVTGSKGDVINFVLVNDLPTLVWLANLATLELHPLLSHAADVQQPSAVVFDLDPGPPADILDCCQVALWLRETFAALGLESFVKTSGSKGMQLYVPLNIPVTYEQTKPFAHAIALLMEREHKGKVVSSMSKAQRVGKVFIDWSQNDDHKSTIAVYSLRARERPTVSTPLTWDEVEAACERQDASHLRFESADVLERVDRLGDLFAPLLTLEQELPALA